MDYISQTGKSLREVASEIGISHPVLWHFIATDDSHRDIRVERTADKIAEFLGLELVPCQKRRTKRG